MSLHDGSRRNIVERLSRLYQQGYLDRPKSQSSARLTSSHMVYALGRKGAELLSKDAEEREGIYRRVKEAERTLPLIAHSLMISQFRVCLSLALKTRDDVKLIRWLQGDDLKRVLTRGGRSPELVPDAFFVLEGKEWTHPFFLEADRGTMSVGRFVSKLRVYWRWSQEGRCKATTGFPHFRVLTITPQNGRCENLRLAAKDADDKRTGSPIFLFAPESRYNVSAPEALFGEAWKCPKDDTPRSVLK